MFLRSFLHQLLPIGLLLFFCSQGSSGLQAQDRPDLSVIFIPDTLFENADAVIRSYSLEFRVQDLGKAFEKKQLAITILNEDSPLNHFECFYDNASSVLKMSGILYDANGKKVRSLSKKDIEDKALFQDGTIASDDRYKQLSLSNGNSFPYTVVFNYEKKYTGILEYPDWQLPARYASMQQGEFIVSLPSSLPIRYQSQNLTSPEPTKVHDGESIVYKWTFGAIKALPSEPFSTPWHAWMHRVQLSPSRFSFGPYEGNYSDWVQYGDFHLSLNKDHNNLSDYMKATIQNLTNEASTIQEKIDVLYRYLQENTRYVSIQLGIGGYKAFDAAYVEKNKFGDCKALTYFMKSMLEEVDIEAYPALIQSGYFPQELDSAFAFSSFNHVILYVPEINCWLECTSKHYPMGYLGGSNANHPVLWLTPEGGKLGTTPAYPASKNQEIGHYKLLLDQHGSATIEGSVRFEGILHDKWRSYYFTLSEEDLMEKAMGNYPYMPSPGIEAMDFQVSEDQPTLEIQLKMNSAKYGTKSGNRLFVPVNGINPLHNRFPKSEERTLDIATPYGYTIHDEITFHIPEGYRVEAVPFEREEIQTSWGSVLFLLDRISPQEFKFSRILVAKKFVAPSENYPDIFNFYAQVAKIDQAILVLVKI